MLQYSSYVQVTYTVLTMTTEVQGLPHRITILCIVINLLSSRRLGHNQDN